MDIPSKIENVTQIDFGQEKVMRRLALAAILILAAALSLSNLSVLGDVNHYYTAAVKSMLASWHNFFFVAAEPGGSVSVDKPPVGLWLEAISAAIFGVNTFGVLLPQILAGLLSVAVLYHLVRRWFGTLAGLLAALAMAITPVFVATERNNTIDMTLIFTLLLAAWAFIKATETSRLRYLLFGAVLVGIAFNIKMLEAYLPLPAFAALYFFGAKEGIWKKTGKLVLTGLVVLVISLSWATIVDLTPPEQRPYVGSSGDNSELSLIIGYNGLSRLLGMRFGRAFSGVQASGGFPQGAPGFQGRPGFQGGRPGGFAGGGFRGRSPGGFGGGPTSGTGLAGPLRLFTAPLSKEASWLLPFGLISLLALLLSVKLAWPFVQEHQAAALWGGWLLTPLVFFSVAGFFHEYYLSTMVPPLSALFGIGVALLWRLSQKEAWLAALFVALASAATLALQFATAGAFIPSIPWQPVIWLAFVIGVGLVCAAGAWLRKGLAAAGYSLLVASMLITPGIWAGLTNLYPSSNQSLPAAYSGRSSEPPNMGSVQVNQKLLSYLQANTKDNYYLMAVPSSMQGADYVIATGRPVLYMGGFMGQDQVVTPQSLSALVSSGKLRYIYWNAAGGAVSAAGGRFGIGQNTLSGWVTSQCTVVPGFDTSTRNSGAPDGTGAGSNNDAGRGFFGPGGEMQVSLYDCAGSNTVSVK